MPAARDISLSQAELQIALAVSERAGNFNSATVRQKLTGTLKRSKSDTRLETLGAQDSPRGSLRRLTSNESGEASNTPRRTLVRNKSDTDLSRSTLVRNKSATDLSAVHQKQRRSMGGIMAQRMALLDKLDVASIDKLDAASILQYSIDAAAQRNQERPESKEATMQGAFSRVSSSETDKRLSGRNTLPSLDSDHEAGPASVSHWMGHEQKGAGILTEFDLAQATMETLNESGQALKQLWIF
jgi:hypothetical protein